MKLIAKIEPMGAVRMTQRGKWTSLTAQKYLAYKQAIGYQFRQQLGEPTIAACAVRVTFYMPIPLSWSQKKRREHIGQPVKVKPDIDNLVKGLFDAANGVIWRDDNLVVHCEAKKVYAAEPKIELEVTELF